MAKKTLGVGVIGTGWVAGAHIDNFRRVEGCRIVAICSRTRRRAQEYIHQKGLNGSDSGAAAYDDIDAFLAHPDLDIVALATPHDRHPDETIAAARAGKHVLIEKPVALVPAELARMVAAVNKAGVKTSVCFELRWIGLFKNVKALLEQRAIGDIFYGEVSYFHGIGPWYGMWGWNRTKSIGRSSVLTAGCHAIDGLLWFMNSRVAEVAAMSATSRKNPLKYEYDPNAVAILRFENGAIGKVASSVECRQPYLFPVLLQGDKGSIWNDQVSRTDWPGLKGWAKLPTDLPESGEVEHHPYQGQFEHFVDCIRTGKAPDNDLSRCAHVHEVCFAIDEAIRTRKTVKVKRTPGT